VFRPTNGLLTSLFSFYQDSTPVPITVLTANMQVIDYSFAEADVIAGTVYYVIQVQTNEGPVYYSSVLLSSIRIA
jgi:hypothetical protein